MQFSIDLPLPPSANRLWRTALVCGRPRTYKSEQYVRWMRIADGYLLANRPAGWTQLMIVGAFDAEIVIDRKKLRGGDGDNRSKAILDWLQRRHVIKDDKYLRELKVTVGEHDLGCHVELRSVDLAEVTRQAFVLR